MENSAYDRFPPTELKERELSLKKRMQEHFTQFWLLVQLSLNSNLDFIWQN